MKTYFDKEVLQQSSIFELRNIAREIGVYSPTIYKKEELIDKIFQIVNGEVKPYVPKSKQGRPPKSLMNPVRKSVFDQILPTEERTYNIEEEPSLCLSESMIAFLEDDKAKVKTNFDVEGVIELTPYGYGFVKSIAKTYTTFEGAYISQNLIANHKLKNGDYIKGMAKLLEEDKPYVLYEITSVNNGVMVQDFDKLDVTYSLTRLELNNEIDNFLVGSANLIIQNKEDESSAYDYLKSISNDYKLIIVKLDVNKEQEFIQKSLQEENYYTTMLQKPNEHIGVVKLALSRAKRLASQGSNIVLCIDGVDKVIKNQNALYGNDLLDIRSNTFDIIKQLSMSARQLKNIGSLTIVGLYNQKRDNSFDALATSELEDYFSKIYKAKKQG